MCPSETIYRSYKLFIQARGVLKKELIQHLASKRLIRRSRHSRAAGTVSEVRSSMPSLLAEDLAEVEDRAISRSLGGRSARRQQKQFTYRNHGGTSFAFHHAGQSAQQETQRLVSSPTTE